mmetsp:Transcript_25580/g.43125  ORF Transcript_25580/g.43125 Transcript_25580/m.43125 type:complete len:322 (+) Transcript_25580:50-1015(+)
MSQLLDSADESMERSMKRWKRYCLQFNKKRICCTAFLLVYFIPYFYSSNKPDVDLFEYTGITTVGISIDTISTFDHESFQWMNDPKLQSIGAPDPSGETPGSGGDHTVTAEQLTLAPPAFRDFWSRTFYSPTLVKHDASALLRSVPYEAECTVEVDFEVTPKNQFDQAGLMVYIDDAHWVKAGIEYTDGAPRLSVVVTNVFSDWSTQPWPSTSARLRLHKINKGSSLVVEACAVGSDDYSFVRIAHLSSLAVHLNSPRYELRPEHTTGSASPTGRGLDWQIGPYAASPMAQKGCVARFSQLEFGPRKEVTHSADVSEMTEK